MLEYINRFLINLEADPKYSKNTSAAYKNDLNQFSKYLQQREEGLVSHPSEITSEILQGFVVHLQERGYASSTVARKLAAVKSLFHFLAKSGEITSAPTANLATPRFKKQSPKVLSHEQVERLLVAPGSSNTPKSSRDRALLELLYATGMRVTEVVSLQVSDVDLEAGRVSCHSQNKRDRVMPINSARALRIIRDYISRVRPALVKQPGHEALFLNHRGQPLTRQGLWLIIKSYADKAGVAGQVTPHTLRHSFAYHALSQGEDIRRLQQLLGHANLSTTQVYTQLNEATPEPGQLPEG